MRVVSMSRWRITSAMSLRLTPARARRLAVVWRSTYAPILPSMGAYVLRHTTASRLARAGVSLKDIADVMRHRDIDTTRIYKIGRPSWRETIQQETGRGKRNMIQR